MSTNDVELKKIAEKAKKEYRIDSPTDENVAVVSEIDTAKKEDDDAPVVILSTKKSKGAAEEEVGPITDEEIPGTGNAFELTDDDLRAVMPDLDDLTYKREAADLREAITGYRKRLIINGGLTPEEVNEAAQNRLKNMGTEINNKYLETNPKLGIIEIDKKNVDKVEFTPEEKAKMTQAKAIRLITVEDEDLKTITVEKVEKSKKSAFLKTIEGNLSKYSLPLPITGDYVTFKGAQIIQLIGTVKYDDESFDELINKKSSLIYDRMIGGTVFNKYGDNNKVTMSYTDFVNQFKFHDIDMALFGILVASSMEEVESTLTCAQCEEPFQWRYNLKSLLHLDTISDAFKQTIETILGNKYEEEILGKINAEGNKVRRFKSPFTKNIYDVAYPTVARAIKIYQAIDQKDTTMVYLSTLGIFIHSLFVYNEKTGTHMEIEEDEIKTLMEALQMVPQQDLDLLFNQAKDMMYSPEFKLESQCPFCGHKMTNSLSVDDLVFLRAQDTSTEIR